MDNTLTNQIRNKVDIVDIVGERIPLVAKGKNFFGVCPFHDDSNPSMCVSREKQIYTCFSCHATGNVFTFLMNYEHMDFKETLKYLGNRVGIDTGSIHIAKKSTKYDKYYDAYKLSLKYYQNNLNSSVGKEAKDYLQKRKIDEKIIKEYEIGLSLDKRDDLTTLLQSKDNDLVTLNRIGLSTDKYDIYSERIMFPLYDTNGRVVAFSGRIYKEKDLKDKTKNKYLNTKETDIFKKGQLLYHYHIAKEECRKAHSVIVMEGFMDVIRASTIGINNTVALMGTALTKEQVALLKRLSNNIILCLDGDDPGQKAMLSIGDHLLEQGIEVKIIKLPNPDDPDTYILKNGKDRFVGLVESAINFSDFKFQRLRENVDFRSDEEKPQKEEVIIPKKEQKKKNKYTKAYEQIIYFMLNNDWVITQVEKERIIFPTETMRELSSEIIYYYKKYGNINIADFYTYIQDKSNILILINDILGDSYNEKTTKDELFLYFKVTKEYCEKQEIKRLTNLMKKEVDPIEQAKIVEKIRKLRLGDS